MNMIRNSVLERLSTYDKDFRLTNREVSDLTGIPIGTLGNHRYSGLLPFIPGRPIHYRVGDLRIYLKMMGNGVAAQLHPSLRIAHADRRAYNPLGGVDDFTAGRQGDVIDAVIEQTNALWNRYKAEGSLYKKKKPKAKRARKR